MANSVTIRKLVTRWGFDVDDRDLNNFESTIDNLKRGVTAVGAAAASGATTLFGIAKSVADAGDEAAKTSQVVGTTAQEFQELKHAASIADVGVGELRTGLRRGARNFKDFANGEGEARDAIESLGIQVTDANGDLKSQADLIETVAGRFSQMEDGARKTALASEIFGRSGSKLIPLFNQGADGIQNLRQEARDLGVVMSEDTVNASAEFQDQMHRAWQIIRGLRNSIGAELIPIINDVIEGFRGWVDANRDWIESGLKSAIDDTISFLETFWSVTTSVIGAVDDFAESIGGWEDILDIVQAAIAVLIGTQIYTGISSLVAIVGALASGFSASAVAAWAANAAVAAIPLAIGALIAAVGLLIEDIYRWTQGQESLVGDALENFPLIESIIYAIGDAVQLVWDIFTGLFEWLTSTIWSSVPDMVQNWITSLDDFAAQAWTLLTGAFEGIWDSIENLFFDMISTVTSEISDLVETVGSYADSIPGVSAASFQNLADQLDRVSGLAQGTGAGARGAMTAAQREQVFQRQQQGNFRFAPTYNVEQRPGEDGEGLAARIDRRRRQDMDRRARQTSQFFGGGEQY